MGLIGGLIGIGTGIAMIASAATHDVSHHPSHLWTNVAFLAAVAVLGPPLIPEAAGSFSQYVPLAAVAALVSLATGQWAAFGGFLLAAVLALLTTRMAVMVARRRAAAAWLGDSDERLQRPTDTWTGR